MYFIHLKLKLWKEFSNHVIRMIEDFSIRNMQGMIFSFFNGNHFRKKYLKKISFLIFRTEFNFFLFWSLTFLTITTFTAFCYLNVICVVKGDLKIASHQKNGINWWKFSCDYLLRLSTWIIKYKNASINLFPLLSMKPHPMPLWNPD